MRFVSSLRNIIAMLIALFSVCYTCLAVGNDLPIGEQYTVKINDVLFRRDIAESVMLRIKSQCKCNSIKAYDNVHKVDIELSEIQKDMDVNIERNELLSALSDLYKVYTY